VFTDAPPAAAAAFAHQRLDHRALLAPVTKWSTTMVADHAGAVMDEAIARAMDHPRGPVHVDCPADVLSADLLAHTPRAVDTTSSGSPGAGPTLEALASLLASARRPLLIVGAGACDADTTEAVRNLCATCRVGALVTYKAKGVVPDGDPHFAGVFTNGSI